MNSTINGVIIYRYDYFFFRPFLLFNLDKKLFNDVQKRFISIYECKLVKMLNGYFSTNILVSGANSNFIYIYCCVIFLFCFVSSFTGTKHIVPRNYNTTQKKDWFKGSEEEKKISQRKKTRERIYCCLHFCHIVVAFNTHSLFPKTIAIIFERGGGERDWISERMSMRYYAKIWTCSLFV